MRRDSGHELHYRDCPAEIGTVGQSAEDTDGGVTVMFTDSMSFPITLNIEIDEGSKIEILIFSYSNNNNNYYSVIHIQINLHTKSLNVLNCHHLV